MGMRTRTKGQLQGQRWRQGRGYRDREKKRGGDRDRNRDKGHVQGQDGERGEDRATGTKDSGSSASHTPPMQSLLLAVHLQAMESGV